ncbi:MAG: putative ABC transporter permease, partial [Oscillospiraceae bacterium]|nr:putative ABC transporter permease [Oscillospiraceae bacterium]
NLKGRICLWVCLMWGVLSFLVLYFIHPQVAGFLAQFNGVFLYFLDGVLLGILMADAGATILQLVKTSQMMRKLRQAGDELRLRAHLGKAELSELLEGAKAGLSDRLEDLIPDQLDEAGRAAKERYDELMARTEMITRRFRDTYREMRASLPDAGTLESVKRRGEWVKEHLKPKKKNK